MFLSTYLKPLIQSIIQYFLKKLELHGITDRNHSWFKNFLSNRKQFIRINNEENTTLETITCGVSILGPLPFLVYVNDLKNASNLLDTIMFTDDTNLFLTHEDISYLFETANLQLERINLWFISNKLSLNVIKIKYSFFHKPSKKDDILLLLPKLNINNSEIEQSECLKFLGVLLDENRCWKDHIKYVESKISKNIGLLYKTAKPYIDKHSLLSLYHYCIHPILTTETLHGEVEPEQTLKNFTFNRNMLSELYIVKIDCYILENSLRSVKLLMYIKSIFGKFLFLCIKLTQTTIF